ncbi:two-component regulator propeller domain-containing protein [Marinicella sp. W31]|uniref:hybrid sensor histidine kinase/response regulator transcription factor n=1 Tax=Marinicella sp. W31 TaxID=3023713 RepID=UPI0037563359
MRTFKLSFLLLLLFSGDVLSSIARFNHLGFEQGFEHKTVRQIVQDHEGFIWLGTTTGLIRFDGYDTREYLLPQQDKTTFAPNVTALMVTQDGALWIGTSKNGLFRYQHGSFSQFSYSAQANSISANTIVSMTIDKEGTIWITSRTSVDQLSPDGVFTHIRVPTTPDQPIRSIHYGHSNGVMLSTNNGLYFWSKNSQEFIQQNIMPSEKTNQTVFVVHEDSENRLWIGTEYGLLLQTPDKKTYRFIQPDQINNRVVSIQSDQDNIWLGTIFGGLIKVSKLTQQVTVFVKQPFLNHSLSENNVLSLFLDREDVLWIGTFSSGLSYFSTHTLNFGFETASPESVYCSKSSVFNHVYHDTDGFYWISTENGLIKYHPETRACERYVIPSELSNTHPHQSIYRVDPHPSYGFLVSTQDGILQFDKKQNIFLKINIQIPQTITNFAATTDDQKIIIGTYEGLFLYDHNTDHTQLIDASEDLPQPLKIYSYTRDASDQWLFASLQGLLVLENNQIIRHPVNDQLPAETDVISLFISDDGHIWIGTASRGLFHYDTQNHSVTAMKGLHGFPENFSAYSLLEDINGHLWIGTNQGLFYFDTQQKKVHQFSFRDGLQSNAFTINASAYGRDDQLIFSGTQGMNIFNPKSIPIKSKGPQVALTDLNHFNDRVSYHQPTEKFSIQSPLNQLSQLELTHLDYVIGIEFSAMDYTDSQRNQYAYRLQGFNPEWNYVDASDRKVTYTNLSAGEYDFQVKAANKDGIWNSEPRQLKLIVKPAPWFSWWAISIYLLLGIFSLYGYIKMRIHRSEQTARLLQKKVKQSTAEIQRQKQTVESLLIRKNELFANVSHEFRTPLALILGPLDQLMKDADANSLQSMKMIRGNTVRLRNLVEQMLQLAEISELQHSEFTPQHVLPVVKRIVASFESIALEKNIRLELKKTDDAIINITPEALDIILGNFISNALKYTESDGLVSISSVLENNRIQISVSDSGPGLDTQEISQIFKRFTRLQKHQSIQGSGIGLAVAQEVAEINEADIFVHSEPGDGAQFTVSFPLSDHTATETPNQSYLINQLVQSTSEDLKNHEPSISQSTSEDEKNSVLIIEDNADMRQYIHQILSDQYHCILAEDGSEGIAMALEHIPDLIISDVMMPKVQGYEVSRTLRNDERTSHIPLILLTALKSKQDRMRGWREHIDAFISKPFDADELKIRISNILVIRDIIKRKTSLQLESGTAPQELSLPLMDQNFLDKFRNAMEKQFANPLLTRTILAENMAVSERQLQRKVKALTDLSPMDMLREFRLMKSKLMLKDGYQVGLVSDACGFNSVSYFSRCFKAQFGMSPKKYQQLD